MRIGTNSISTVGQLNASEADIPLPVVHQDIVRLDVCGLTLIRAQYPTNEYTTIIPVCA